MEYPLTYERFKEALKEGQLLGLECQRCKNPILPPTMVCKGCGGRDLKVRPFSPEGVIRSFTVVRVAPEGFDAPYIVAMVELKEGPWVLGNLLDVDPNGADLDLIDKGVTVSAREAPSDAFSGGELVALTFRLKGD
jgi:hypothetical protein